MSVFDELKIEDPEKVFKPVKNNRPTSIIKKESIKLNTSVRKINPYDNNHIPLNKGKITPLTDNGDVIGFIYECSCGEIAKVIFDFEETFG